VVERRGLGRQTLEEARKRFSTRPHSWFPKQELAIMLEMSRVWPIVCEFGVGGALGAIGIWAGLTSGYLCLKRRDDRRLLAVLIGGYLLLLAGYCLLTFMAPHA